MDGLKKTRTAHRAAFTRTLNELNTALAVESPDKDDVAITFELLQEKMVDLDGSASRLLSKLIEDEENEALIETENSTNDAYKKSI